MKLHKAAPSGNHCAILWNALGRRTCGDRGCWYWGSDGPDPPRRQPAFEVEVVDTTGCGDVFHGAYAAALAEGLDPAARVRLASATAALKATRSGGQAGIPVRDTVEAFLQASGR